MKKKIIVLTGATRGLGRAMVTEFAQLDHTVIGCGRSAKDIQQLEKTVIKPHRFSVVNVASDNEVKAWADTILTEFGAPDLLLNNAAIINRNAPLWSVPASEFSRVVDINVKGVVNVIRHFVPAMIERKTGVIVNFS